MDFRWCLPKLIFVYAVFISAQLKEFRNTFKGASASLFKGCGIAVGL